VVVTLAVAAAEFCRRLPVQQLCSLTARPPVLPCSTQAKDALHVMDGRLSGTLLGVLSTPSLPLSVEGQAARLIDEATDHENLGRMYIWWMPWL
jgi:phosphatidylinositol kinase/protein kinase (PI-3  family)